MSVAKKISANPFIRIIVPIVLGVVAAQYLPLKADILWALFAVIYTLAWITAGKKFGFLYVSTTLLLCSAALSNSYRTVYSIPEDRRIYACLQVMDNPVNDGRWQKSTAVIGYYRLLDDQSKEWIEVDQKIFLNVDTCHKIALGEQFACSGYIRGFDTDGQYEDFGKLMKARRYVGTLYVTSGNLTVKSPVISKTPMYYARLLQGVVLERIDRLNISENESAIAATLVAGERRGIDKDLREAYSRVGASHLLSVSGLHVGIVFTFVNILLFFLPIFKKGHVAKNIIVIGLIWIYAALTGFSASVVRAAMMFSGAQIALASIGVRDAVNIMFGVAAVMLFIEPNNLYDISFQLSFVAVFFILLMFYPVFHFFRTKNVFLNIAISAVIIGIVSMAGTLPLVSYKFGNVSIIGILIGPILVFCTNLILIIGIGWVIAPFSMLQGVVGWVLERIIWIQNEIIVQSSLWPISAVEYRMPIGGVVICYVVLCSFAVWLWAREPKEALKIE